MGKKGYRSIFEGGTTIFERHVCIDGKFDRTWRFKDGENADHVVREWVERTIGPIEEHTVSVADPESSTPMRMSNPGMGLP